MLENQIQDNIIHDKQVNFIPELLEWFNVWKLIDRLKNKIT